MGEKLVELAAKFTGFSPSDLRVLEAFDEHLKGGRFSLSRLPVLDRRSVSYKALELSIQRPVEFFEIISVAEPFPKPFWMTIESEYRNCVARNLRQTLERSLGASIRKKHDLFPESIWQIEAPKLYETVQELRKLLSVELAQGFGNLFPVVFADGLTIAILGFLQFLKTGELKHASNLKPLLKMLSVCYPICELQEETGIWLIAVA